MKKPGIFKRLALVIGFIAMLASGYMAMSVATSNCAQAQVCGCGLCVYQGASSVSAGLTFVGAQVVTNVGIASGLIIANYTLAVEAFALQVSAEFAQIVININDWFDTFWHYNLRPAMQASTEQTNAIDMQQASTQSGQVDAAEMNRAIARINQLEVESERAYRPGENVCVAGTVTGGMTRANRVARAYAAAAPADSGRRSTRSAGTPAEKGRINDTGDRIGTYKSRYCNPADNNGSNVCATAGAFPDADIDVTAQVFQKETIDLKDADTKKSVDDMITNIAEPFPLDNIPATALNSAQGAEAMLKGEAHTAKRQLIYTALYYSIARRAPGSQMGSFISDIRSAAGIPTDALSDNPSYNEIMEVMMNERFRTGKYTIEQIDTPENNEREMVIQSAFQVMHMHDQLDLLDRYGLLVAAEAGMEANEQRPFNSNEQVRPVR